MKSSTYILLILAILIMYLFPCCGEAQDSMWIKDFGISNRTLVTTGTNKFFILEPGYQLILEGEAGLSEKVFVRLEIIVLNETEEVAGIVTRIVEEREWKDNELYEVARNFFAIDQDNNDVFYFGEEVDFYKGGKIINHSGAWLAGEDNAQPGLIMPGEPVVGMKYYQELAPHIAMDRAEIISLDEEFETPAGLFSNCLKTKEGTSLNPAEKEYKTYAPGIGLIQDEKLRLVSYGFIDKN